MTDEVEEIDRESIANEVFGRADQEEHHEAEQDSIDEKESEIEEPSSQWAQIDPAIQAEMDGLKAKISSVDAMEERLKQAERRLGGVLNELHAAKESAKQTNDAPSNEQMQQAAENQKAWDELKEDFPEWAAGIDNRIAATSAEIKKNIPDVTAMRQEITEEFNAKYEDLLLRMSNNNVIASRHANWLNDVNSDEFQLWRQENNVPDTNDPATAISILDSYYEHKQSKPSVKDIKAEREQRLKSAETIPGRKMELPKSEADMTYEELRAHIAKETFK
jgi:hypothetical protein